MLQRLAIEACKVIFFLCVLPCLVTYSHLRQSLAVQQVVVSEVLFAPSSSSYYFTFAGHHRSGKRLTPSADALGMYTHVSDRTKSDIGSLEWDTSKQAFCGRLGCVADPELRQGGAERRNSEDRVVASRSIAPLLRVANPNWKLVVEQIPATCLLIALNVGLAYVYWDRRLHPTAVAKVYDHMINSHHEAWRSFTGSTAHFEIWHLAVNMMSLSALGQELEGRGKIYSPLEFMYYNIILMPIVSLIWCAFQWLTIQRRSQTDYQPSPTVGYSGVLFAWMVVASLEQPSTCPVIFLPSLCFRTYRILGHVKFSFSPLVQLVVMQFILPRVSFFGHLAGIVAGFVLYWKLLPSQISQPSVLIPGMYLVYLRVFRSQVMTGTSSSEPRKSQGYLLLALLLVTLASVFLLESFSFAAGMALSMIYWFCICRAEDESALAAVLGRGFIVSAVLVIISDAMALGTWFAMGIAFANVFPVSVLAIRTATLLLCCVLLMNQQETDLGGILTAVLGFTTLAPCRCIAEQLLTRSPSDHGFAGRGHRLGRGVSSSFDSSDNDHEMSRLI